MSLAMSFDEKSQPSTQKYGETVKKNHVSEHRFKNNKKKSLLIVCSNIVMI